MSTPRIWGPITGGRRGWPFAAAIADLPAAGYVEEEYFFAGEAPLYRATATRSDGRWSTERAGSQPFRSRILMRRPLDPAKFNGTVIVHWSNVTAGFENIGCESAAYLDGFAIAAVSAQRVGVHGFEDEPRQGLHSWDPERYGELHIANDDLSYGIFTLTAQLVGPNRPLGGVDPMGGLQVERLLAGGASQSAGRLAAYINGVQPIERMFQGFLPTIYFGSATPLNTEGAAPVRPGGRPVQRVNVLLRDDLGVPIFVVNTETETMAYLGSRQPDTHEFRFWELAGCSHVSTATAPLAEARYRRDWGVARPVMKFAKPPNGLPTVPVMDAALAAMQRWMSEGVAPPTFAPITVTGEPPEIARDADGNALGGIRMPDFDVPLAASTGNGDGAEPLAFLYGTTIPFEAGRLAALYPSREAYLTKYRAAATRAVDAGYLLPRDAAALVALAVAEARPGQP